VLPQAPQELTLQFEEPVSPLVLRLIDPGGRASDLTTFEVRDDTITIRPPAQLSDGTHVLSWRVISADGHPVGGSLVFSVGTSSGNARRAASSDTDRSVRAAIWIARVILYAGLFVGVGGAVFAAWIAGQERLRGPARRVILFAIGCGLAATCQSVGLQGLDALAAPLSSLSHHAVWNQGLHTTYNATALGAAAALLLAWFSLTTAKLSRARIASAAGLIAMGIALAASGHAASATPQWLTRTSIFLHVTCLAFWLGALVPLFSMLRGDDPQGLAIMGRFSAAILPVVLVLAIAGAALVVVQVPSLDAIRTSAYGRILLLKLLAVMALLGLAAANRLVFTPALARGDATRRRRFARSIAAEGALVVMILGLVAGWRFTPPPRALAAAAARSEPTFAHIHSDKGMAEVALNPGRAGPATAMITLMSGAGAPLDPQEVTLSLSNPAAGIEPLDRKARRVSRGIWRIDDLIVPVPGRWHVRVDALVSDFDELTLEDGITVRP
jgi:copper transport protein